MERIEIESYKTDIDASGVGHVIVSFNGKNEEIGTIGNTTNLGSDEVHARAEELLRINDFVVAQPKPREKRKYVRKVTLGMADDYGKVTLNIVEDKPKIVVGYILYVKGTTKFVYKLDNKGIYVKDDAKIKPLMFTSDDVKKIKNIADFDIKKVTLGAGKWIKNKIA